MKTICSSLTLLPMFKHTHTRVLTYLRSFFSGGDFLSHPWQMISPPLIFLFLSPPNKPDHKSSHSLTHSHALLWSDDDDDDAGPFRENAEARAHRRTPPAHLVTRERAQFVRRARRRAPRPDSKHRVKLEELRIFRLKRKSNSQVCTPVEEVVSRGAVTVRLYGPHHARLKQPSVWRCSNSRSRLQNKRLAVKSLLSRASWLLFSGESQSQRGVFGEKLRRGFILGYCKRSREGAGLCTDSHARAAMATKPQDPLFPNNFY